jgi:hypothetical protein
LVFTSRDDSGWSYMVRLKPRLQFDVVPKQQGRTGFNVSLTQILNCKSNSSIKCKPQ